MSQQKFISRSQLGSFGPCQILSKKKSPIDKREIYEYEDDPSKIDQGIAFLSSRRKAWAKTSLEERINIISNFIKVVDQKSDFIAQVISEDTGKPLWESKVEAQAIKIKAQASIEQLKELEPKSYNDNQSGIKGTTSHKPLGLMAIISPYNFPLHLINEKVIPALLTGNSIILKPSEKAARCGDLYCQLLWESGLPSDALVILQGGAKVGLQLASHPDINGILFTGTLEAGLQINESVARQPNKLVCLEMGGINSLIIWKDADIKAACMACLSGFALSSGQRCTSTRRLLIHEEIKEAFIKEITPLLQNMKIGDPFSNPFCGPLINEELLIQNDKRTEDLLSAGGQIISQAKLKGLQDNGYYTAPKIIEISNFKEFSREEVFSPILSLETIFSKEEIIEKNNWSPYGLVSSIFTASPKVFAYLKEELKSGVIHWNQSTNCASSRLPYGGIGLSGNFRPSGYDRIYQCGYSVTSVLNPNPESIGKTQIIGLNK